MHALMEQQANAAESAVEPIAEAAPEPAPAASGSGFELPLEVDEPGELEEPGEEKHGMPGPGMGMIS